jgi:peptidoglycan/LPS O-acetylase OafA/YrhL
MAHSPDSPLTGLDSVRVFAVCLVTAQHALTLLDHEAWATTHGISIGQLGVALFLGVSGLLAVQSRRPAFQWLGQRLRRVFPAYWLALGLSFAATALTGYKHFDLGQVLAQACGVGLFTHPHNLVNSATWFISLLLVCYLGVFLGRWWHCLRGLSLVSVLGLAVVVAVEPRPWLTAHLLTFSVVAFLAPMTSSSWRPCAFGLAAGTFLAAACWQIAFACTGITLLLLSVCGIFRHEPRLVHLAADYSYEYYLLHGAALIGAIRLFPERWWIAVPAGIVLAGLAAVLLRGTVHWLSRLGGNVAVQWRQKTAGPLTSRLAAR